MFGDIESAVAEARAANDETLTDACTITRANPDAGDGWNPVTGGDPAPPLTVHRDLPCRLREPSASDIAAVAGEHQFHQGDAILRLSAVYDTTVYGDPDVVGGVLRIGDTVLVGSPLGVSMAGTFTVQWPVSGSHMSSARFVVRKVI